MKQVFACWNPEIARGIDQGALPMALWRTASGDVERLYILRVGSVVQTRSVYDGANLERSTRFYRWFTLASQP